MIKNLTCIICPRGCALTVDTDKKTVSGNSCKRGEVYGINECINPVRTITSSMKVENREYTAVSVKTDKPVAKSDMFKVVEEIKKAKDELAAAFIVSEVEITEGGSELEIKVEKAEGEKCERCWTISKTVGENSEHPTLCARCCENLK